MLVYQRVNWGWLLDGFCMVYAIRMVSGWRMVLDKNTTFLTADTTSVASLHSETVHLSPNPSAGFVGISTPDQPIPIDKDPLNHTNQGFMRPEKWVCLKIVYPYTQWLMIIIPIKWLFHWGYTLFSDKPKWTWIPLHQDCRLHATQPFCRLLNQPLFWSNFPKWNGHRIHMNLYIYINPKIYLYTSAIS